jgi:hypothetical protein
MFISGASRTLGICTIVMLGQWPFFLRGKGSALRWLHEKRGAMAPQPRFRV